MFKTPNMIKKTLKIIVFGSWKSELETDIIFKFTNIINRTQESNLTE